MTSAILTEQKKLAAPIDEVLSGYVRELERILTDDKITEKERTNKVFYQLKLIKKRLEVLVPANSELSGVQSKVNTAVNGMINEGTGIPKNISEILSELKGEAPQEKKEDGKKKMKDENEFTKPTEMSFEWLAANATYSNIEAYYEKNKNRGWTREEFEFLYPFLVGKQVIEDWQNNASYGNYVSGGVHDCFDFATGDVPKRCKSENGFSNTKFAQLRLRDHIPARWDTVLGGIPPKFPFLSFEEAPVFYLRPGDIIGTQTSPNSDNTHWAVVGVENGEVTTIGFTGKNNCPGNLQPLTIPDFFAHNSQGFDVIRNSPDFEYNEVIKVTVTKSGGSYDFKVEIVPRKEMDKSVGKLNEIGYFVGRD